jgi:hypothetical protein
LEVDGAYGESDMPLARWAGQDVRHPESAVKKTLNSLMARILGDHQEISLMLGAFITKR